MFEGNDAITNTSNTKTTHKLENQIDTLSLKLSFGDPMFNVRIENFARCNKALRAVWTAYFSSRWCA